MNPKNQGCHEFSESTINRAMFDTKIESTIYQISKNRVILGVGLTQFMFAYGVPHFANVPPLILKQYTHKMLEY